MRGYVPTRPPRLASASRRGARGPPRHMGLRAGLGESARDEIGPAEDRDTQPCLTGDKPVGSVVAAADDRRGDQNRPDRAKQRPELRRLERGLRLGRKSAGAVRDATVRSSPARVVAPEVAMGTPYVVT